MDGTPSEQKQSRSGVQVIGRAAAILRLLRDDPEGLSLGQIAQRVDLARSTVQRIVAALQAEQMVVTMGNGGIRLGPEMISFAAGTHYDMVDHCRPFLERLAQITGETADLSVLRGGQMIFLDQVPGSHRLRTVSAIGDAFCLTETANGRAVLAALPRAEAKALILAELGKPAFAAQWPDLEALLDDITTAGLASDLDHHTAGISAMGFAFRDWSGVPHAISVPVPSTRFVEKQGDIAKALQDVRAQIFADLGTSSQT